MMVRMLMLGGSNPMKKPMIVAATFATLAALHRFGPALRERAKAKCLAMFEHMPEDFPPKRIMRSLDEIREQNARILSHLEEEKPSRKRSSEGGDGY